MRDSKRLTPIRSPDLPTVNLHFLSYVRSEAPPLITLHCPLPLHRCELGSSVHLDTYHKALSHAVSLTTVQNHVKDFFTVKNLKEQVSDKL